MEEATYPQHQSLRIMVKQHLSIIPSLRKMERKYKFTPQCDVPPELLPLAQAGDQRSFECLVELGHVLERLVCTFELFPGLVDFFSHLFDRGTVSTRAQQINRRW